MTLKIALFSNLITRLLPDPYEINGFYLILRLVLIESVLFFIFNTFSNVRLYFFAIRLIINVDFVLKNNRGTSISVYIITYNILEVLLLIYSRIFFIILF